MQKFPCLSLLHERLRIVSRTQFTEQLQQCPNSCQTAQKGLSRQKRDGLVLPMQPRGSKLTSIRCTRSTTAPRPPPAPQGSHAGQACTPAAFPPSTAEPVPATSPVFQQQPDTYTWLCVFKDAKQSSFTYGSASRLLSLVKKEENSVGSRESCVTPASQSFPKIFFLPLQRNGDSKKSVFQTSTWLSD